MKLIEVDTVQFQASQTAFAGFAKMLRISVFRPAIRAAAVESAFRGNNEARGVRVKGFGDDLLAHIWAVGIGSINEVDAEIHGALEDLDCFVAVCRFAP